MQKRARLVITTALAGTALVVASATTAEAAVIPQAPSPVLLPQQVIPLPDGTVAPPPATSAATAASAGQTEKKDSSLPSGKATATSFWDAETASGKPMRYATIASPYWPLGTKVRVTYKGKTAVGVVEDFGPAEWAVAQHDIPAILDLSEKMMADLSGVASNTVHVRFEVLKWGKGGVYRHSGTGYKLAMGRG